MGYPDNMQIILFGGLPKEPKKGLAVPALSFTHMCIGILTSSHIVQKQCTY